MDYCTITDVIQTTGVTSDKMGIDEDDDYTLEDVITKWITFASALIDDYTQNPITESQLETGSQLVETKRNVYCDVCSRIVGNRIALREAYKNYAVIKKDDWTIGNIPSDIFTDNEKNDLDHYKNEESIEKTVIGITAVTGKHPRLHCMRCNHGTSINYREKP